jgi:cysteine desulfurase
MDNAATTSCSEQVQQAMLPYLSEKYGNPSSLYQLAAEARNAVEEARKIVAASIGALPEEIYFTGGGSESDNMALKATAMVMREKGRHIITTKIEHHAVLNSCEWLERQGFEVTYLNVDCFGIVNMQELIAAIRPDTILISVMAANNEIGTIQPIEQIGAIARRKGILFHTDAVQAYTQLPIHVNMLPIDMMSVSAHKIHGPKGVGFLYIRNGTPIESFIHGGAQEGGRRAGTENVAGIVGLSKAAQIAMKTMQERRMKEIRIRNYMIQKIQREIPRTKLNGDIVRRLPNNINVCFEGIEGESLVILLDMEGICASTGSACTSGSGKPSHVLLALGLPEELAHGSLRLTISEETTRQDADYAIMKLKNAVSQLRGKADENVV